MANSYFQFRQFRVEQARSGMKVTTDGCLFGAWVADRESEKSVGRILDIGTGTGLLTLMLAQKLAGQIDAIEVEESVSIEAKENFDHSPWRDRLKVHLSAIQDFHSNEKYDLIICNPPFFSDHLKGSDGVKNTSIHADTLSQEDLVKAIGDHLSDEGRAYVMYPDAELKIFAEWVNQSGLHFHRAAEVRDEPEKKVIRAFGSVSRNPIKDKPIETISIYDSRPDYSVRFKELLKDYYLNIV